MKWKLAVSGALMAGYLVTAAHAQHNGRSDAWCRDIPLDRGTVQICQAYTYQQCMASRVANEFCYPNPRYGRR